MIRHICIGALNNGHGQANNCIIIYDLLCCIVTNITHMCYHIFINVNIRIDYWSRLNSGLFIENVVFNLLSDINQLWFTNLMKKQNGKMVKTECGHVIFFAIMCTLFELIYIHIFSHWNKCVFQAIFIVSVFRRINLTVKWNYLYLYTN